MILSAVFFFPSSLFFMSKGTVHKNLKDDMSVSPLQPIKKKKNKDYTEISNGEKEN